MDGVSFAKGKRASEVFFDVLEHARTTHSSAFEGLRWPKNAKSFRSDYATALLAFERQRLASAHRAEIARTILARGDQSMVFAQGGGEVPLADYLQGRAEPLATETITSTQSPGLVPEVTFRGEHFSGDRVAELADAWLERQWMTPSAHRGVRWSLAQARSSGRAELVGHKIVSLGGGAELSPTRAMLRAGADVLFIDTSDPSAELRDDPRVSGTVSYVPGGADLLTQPREIAATIEKFAGDDPVHVGMYAYSGGAAQEWRLTASMNAIVRALPRDLVRSIVLLISPTTPGAVSEADAAVAAERRARWLWRPLGLGRSSASAGQSGELPNRVSHSIVSLQGVAYQAAQYIGKMMAAEVFATFGIDGESLGDMTVSAPVAPITKTASLSHPLFDAGFEGAELFDILVSEPQATRVMCALLAFHDLLSPEAPSQAKAAAPADRARAILGEQIHGGVYAQPHALEREIVVSALAGLGRSPRLIPPAMRFMMGRR